MAGDKEKTLRTGIRWTAASKIGPWFAGALGAVGVSWAYAGKVTTIGIDVAFTFAATIVIPAGLLKILYDRHTKRRQRKRIKDLETLNKDLRIDRDGLRRRNAELEERIHSIEGSSRKQVGR